MFNAQTRFRRRQVRHASRRCASIEPLEQRRLLSAATGLIFIANRGAGSIGEYTTAGATMNASLITGLNGPHWIAASGSNLFVTQSDGTIGEYTTSGATVNPALISGFDDPEGIVVSGSDLFVVDAGAGSIGEYTTSGATVNAALVPDLPGFGPTGLAISGSNLFVSNYEAEESSEIIGEYTTAGATVNASLISSGLVEPAGMVISGTKLFVADDGQGTIGEYTTSGGVVSRALVTLGTPTAPFGIAQFGSDLFVTNDDGTVGEYTTSGGTVNQTLLSGVAADDPGGICIVGSSAPPSSSNLTPAIVRSTVPTKVISGSPAHGNVTVDISNSGGTSSGTTTLSVYASSDGTIDGGSILLGSVTKKLTIHSGGRLGEVVPIKSLPADLSGSYTLFAQTTDLSGNIGISNAGPALTAAPAFIQPAVFVGAVSPARISSGKSGSILVTVANNGNVAASGVDISLSPSEDDLIPIAGTTLENLTIGVKILPGKSKTFKLHFKASGALSAGTYFPFVSVTLGGQSTTAAGTTEFTVL